jgi:hypothetical protein
MSDNKLGIASLVLGAAALFFPWAFCLIINYLQAYTISIPLPIVWFVSLPAGIAGIILSKKQRKIKPSKTATVGLVLSLISVVINGITLSLWIIFGLLWIWLYSPPFGLGSSLHY